MKVRCLWHPSSSLPSRPVTTMHANIHYYNTKKYCPTCREYVRFLQSLDESFCVDCGSKVRLFSSADKRSFLHSLKQDRIKKAGPNASSGSNQKKKKKRVS